MASLLYFVPNRQTGLSAEELRAIGLGHALDGSVHQQTVSAGPGGNGGVVLADGQHCDPARVRYVPAEQDWVETPFGSLGRWKSDAIGPADLIRDKPLNGHFVELADGKKWLCPVARTHGTEAGAVCWYHSLPRSVSMGTNRKWKPGTVVPRYRRLWEICQAWWDVRAASAVTAQTAELGDTIRFDFDGLHESAVECLATNYRLGPDEISVLGLFDSGSARAILDALIDMPALIALTEELEKKTESLAHAG
jgi:hypothetical protein